MLRGLYQAGAALQSATANQEVTADNLANTTTPGYRRQGMTFDAVVAGQASSSQAPVVASGRGGAESGTLFSSFAPGPMQQTGSPLDVALSGDGFFTIDGPTGPVYTRNGAFVLGPQGELQTASGLRVRGQSGPIRIPPTAAVIRFGADGTVLADGAEVGRLALAQFDDNQALRRVGATLFAGPAPRQPAPDSVRVEQGYREGSNVQMVQEMISMILGLRQYEAAERAMRALGDAIGQNTRPQA